MNNVLLDCGFFSKNLWIVHLLNCKFVEQNFLYENHKRL